MKYGVSSIKDQFDIGDDRFPASCAHAGSRFREGGILMKRSFLVLASMFLACGVYGQDTPQAKAESTPSFLSIHLEPGVSIYPDTALGSSGDVEIWTGPSVGMSLKYRFPEIPWLI